MVIEAIGPGLGRQGEKVGGDWRSQPCGTHSSAPTTSVVSAHRSCLQWNHLHCLCRQCASPHIGSTYRAAIGDCNQSKYGNVILPFTVLRRMDSFADFPDGWRLRDYPRETADCERDALAPQGRAMSRCTQLAVRRGQMDSRPSVRQNRRSWLPLVRL